MKSLLWKQWQESKAYLGLFLIWMVLAAVYCVGYEIAYRFRAPVGHLSGLALFYMVSAAIFLAMRASQGERTAGTLSFSASLPISMRRIAAVRLAGYAATLAIPILVAAAIMSLALVSRIVEQAAPRDVNDYIQLPLRETAPLLTALEQLASVTAIAIFGGLELLLVLSLVGCRLRSQSQVGLLGAVMAFGTMVVAGVFWYGARMPVAQLFYGAVFPQSLVVQWGYGAEHGGYTDHELAQYRWAALALAIPVLVVLGYLFVRQYGRLSRARAGAKPSRLRFRTPAIWSYFPVRFMGRWSALVWLELRQSTPLVTMGLVFALLIAVASKVMEPQFDSSVLAELPHAVAFIGILWATVVGSAIYSAELESGLGGFWRSRPISSRRWFWCKFIVGLAVVLIVLDGVTIFTTWHAPRNSMTTGMSWAYVACFPILHALMYALAVLGTCWLRRPVIGAFVAILGYAMLTIAITAFPMTDRLEPINVYNQLLRAERAGNIEIYEHGYPLVYGVLTASVLVVGMISSRLAKPLEPTFGRFTLLAD